MERAAQSVTSLLQRSVPRDSGAAVAAEFKKDFVFSKKRSRLRKRQRRARSGGLTRAARRALGLCGPAGGGVRGEDARALHALWCGYMRQLLDLDAAPRPGERGWDAFSQSVHRAELVGARVRVLRARCAALVGVAGVVVQDTRCALALAGEGAGARVRVVPKRQVVLELQLGALRLVLFGKHLCVRPAERSVRKVKSLALPDL